MSHRSLLIHLGLSPESHGLKKYWASLTTLATDCTVCHDWTFWSNRAVFSFRILILCWCHIVNIFSPPLMIASAAAIIKKLDSSLSGIQTCSGILRLWQISIIFLRAWTTFSLELCFHDKKNIFILCLITKTISCDFQCIILKCGINKPYNQTTRLSHVFFLFLTPITHF